MHCLKFTCNEEHGIFFVLIAFCALSITYSEEESMRSV